MLKKTRRSFSPLYVPLSALILSAFFVLGVFCGYVLSARALALTGDELQRYFDSYLALGAQERVGVGALAETLVCYFRAPLIVFLLGFASIGVAMIPFVCAFHGFLTSFSLFCFAQSLGRGSFPLLLALFGVRFLAVLPCTLILGAAALEKSRALLALSLGGSGRGRAISYDGAYWYRLGACCVCLLLGSLIELWLVPQFLLLAAS